MTAAESAAPLNLVFQALADPTRRVMLERLTLGPASVSELARPFAMSLPAVVQHLQVLEASGLVRSEKVGRVRTCHIETAPLRNAEHWIGERRTTLARAPVRVGMITGGRVDARRISGAAATRPQWRSPSSPGRPD